MSDSLARKYPEVAVGVVLFHQEIENAINALSFERWVIEGPWVLLSSTGDARPQICTQTTKDINGS